MSRTRMHRGFDIHNICPFLHPHDAAFHQLITFITLFIHVALENTRAGRVSQEGENALHEQCVLLVACRVSTRFFDAKTIFRTHCLISFCCCCPSTKGEGGGQREECYLKKYNEL